MIDQAIKLLHLLSDGNVHSGNDLGEALGVSRAAVWKLIQKIQHQFGVEIRSLPGSGYVLAHKFTQLSEASIQERLKQDLTLVAPPSIHILASTTSTNDIALEAVGKGAPSFSVWLAEHQSSGRGRRGKVWQSPLLGNIYCSVIWRFSGGAPALEGLSLVVGIAIAEALSALGVPGVQIKWPNDIWVEKRKIGGILIEISGDPMGDCAAVIGFGLNMMLSDRLEVSIDQPSSAVSKYLTIYDRNEVTAFCLKRLFCLLNEHRENGFRSFKARWDAYDALKGASVRIVTPLDERTGVCLGVNDRGALLVENGSFVDEVFSGEVSVRVS